MRRRLAPVLPALLLLAAAPAPTSAPASEPAPPLGHEAAAALVAERGCGTCHGERGVSAVPGFPSLAGQQREFVALQLVLFREGLRDVPAMAAPSEGLSDEQVEQLGAYFAALPAEAPPDRRPREPALAAAGGGLAERHRCGVCHLGSFAGQNQVPRINAQREDFLAATLRAYRDGERRGTDTQMNAAVHGLSDADLDALAHYVSHR